VSHRAHAAAPVINRLESLAEEADTVADFAASAAHLVAQAPEPVIRVNTQTVQQTVQRSPKIIKAR
jgi:hypothetical protein